MLQQATLKLERQQPERSLCMRDVAELAGVSVSTVSRVVNDRPNIATTTTRLVRDAMAQLNFERPNQFNRRLLVRDRMERRTLAFLVFGRDGGHTGLPFHHLLRGVSDTASALGANLVFSFVTDSSSLPRSIGTRSIDGLLLLGQQPSSELTSQLHNHPTVWLMASRERPQWGDQVMPNNPLIGEVAVRYLARRGHQRLACLKVENDGWSLRLRGWAFAQAAAESGLEAYLVQTPETQGRDMWCSLGVARITQRLVDQLLALRPRPTGLFVLEDRLVPAIEAGLKLHGLRVGPGADFEILSCNSERGHLVMDANQRAGSIDMGIETIGRRGVEHLLWRITHRDVSDRVTILIEPELVESTTA